MFITRLLLGIAVMLTICRTSVDPLNLKSPKRMAERLTEASGTQLSGGIAHGGGGGAAMEDPPLSVRIPNKAAPDDDRVLGGRVSRERGCMEVEASALPSSSRVPTWLAQATGLAPAAIPPLDEEEGGGDISSGISKPGSTPLPDLQRTAAPPTLPISFCLAPSSLIPPMLVSLNNGEDSATIRE